MINDFVNSMFEFGGAAVLCANVVKLHKDKMVKGVHWSPALFFASWGLWNLYYYPSLDQWLSFFGGAALVLVNLVWLLQVMYYKDRRYSGGIQFCENKTRGYDEKS